MDYSEHELMTIGKELDKSCSFVLLKRQQYRNHKRVKGSTLRFQEVVMIDRRDRHFLEFIVGVFPQEIRKISKGFRLKYYSKEAVYFIWTILPYLKRKKRLAELILEYTELKSHKEYKISKETQAKRMSIYRQLQAERARIRKEEKEAKEKKD